MSKQKKKPEDDKLMMFLIAMGLLEVIEKLLDIILRLVTK